MGLHWTASEYERERYYNWMNRAKSESEIESILSKASQAEKSKRYDDADDLYRAAGCKEKADEMRKINSNKN